LSLHLKEIKPTYVDFRAGDVRHSQADIHKAKSLLGYNPEFRINEGLKKSMVWYVNNLKDIV
jgi:UDP-N-acetylglucosamine 4-epimerase